MKSCTEPPPAMETNSVPFENPEEPCYDTLVNPVGNKAKGFLFPKASLGTEFSYCLS